MRKYEFGDRILYGNMPAVYLHGSFTEEKRHYIAILEYSGDVSTDWATEDQIIHVAEICGVPDDQKINVRDKMVFIYGQICAIQFYCDSNASDALEAIGDQFEKVLKALFKDYE